MWRYPYAHMEKRFRKKISLDTNKLIESIIDYELVWFSGEQCYVMVPYAFMN